MKYFRLISGTIFLGISFLAGSVYAQSKTSVQLRTDVAPTEMYIGDPIQYKITVIFTPDVSPLPLDLSLELGEFQIWDYSFSKPEKLSDDKVSQIHNFILTTYSTGNLTIPSIVLSFQTEKEERAEAKTQPVDIRINSLLEERGDEGNLRPLKGFFNFTSYLWIWILLSLLLGMALLYFIVKTIKNRKKTMIHPKGPPRPPEEIIWDVIQELEDSDLIKEGKTKEFYSRLSVALRHYLENRYKIPALDKTSTELIFEFRNRKLTTECIQLLKQFLAFGDLVKFAKLTPNEDEIDTDLTRVKKLVKLTTPEKRSKRKREAVPL